MAISMGDTYIAYIGDAYDVMSERGDKEPLASGKVPMVTIRVAKYPQPRTKCPG